MKVTGLEGIFVLVLMLSLLDMPVQANLLSGEVCNNHIPPLNETKSLLMQRYYFEGCDFGNKTVLFCPRPLIKKDFNCVQTCVSCHDEYIPWHCLEWKSEGCDPNATEVSMEPCGLSYSNGNWTLGNWTPLDTSGWFCPNARKLAELYTPQPSGLSFNELSLGGKYSNSILRSGEQTDLMFSAYVPACLNRIPMLRLRVKLINGTGSVNSQEYGLYVKHQTLDYLNENHGVIEGFIIPNKTGEDAFRETYVLSSVLDGYVSWAWRRQFVEAAEKIVNVSAGNAPGWMQFDGAVPEEAGRVGDIYFSKDFTGGTNVGDNPAGNCVQNVSMKHICALNLLLANDLDGHQICSLNDLKSYYSAKGLTDNLKDFLRVGCGISSEVEIGGVNFSASETESKISGQNQKIEINPNTLFNMNYSEFKEYISNPSNSAEALNILEASGKISERKVIDDIKKYLRDNFDSSGCTEQVPAHSVYGFDLISINPMEYSNATNLTNATFIILPKIKISEDFIIPSSIGTSFEYNCTQSWTWGSLSNLAPEILAKCMYNWENCMALQKPGGLYEAASAGYGPMEATPTLENDTARILLDGRLSEEKQERNVTVYRSCHINDAWLAPQLTGQTAMLYACPIEAWLAKGGFSEDLQYIGKLPVYSSYPKDYSEGAQYMILKCNRAPSLDEASFVEKVPPGTLISIGTTAQGKKMIYVCDDRGWIPIPDINTTCLDDRDCHLGQECNNGTCGSNCTTDKACPEGFTCVNRTCICTKDEDCSNGQSCFDGVCTCQGGYNCPSGQVCLNGACTSGRLNRQNMFGINPGMVNVAIGQGGFNIWNVNILNKENRTIDAELTITCKDYPAIMNWLDFTNGSTSCGEGCKKTDIILPKTENFDIYRSAYSAVHLDKAERLGMYEVEFVVEEKGTEKEIYRKKAWLNVFSDAVGSESIIGLVAVFLACSLLILRKKLV